MTNQRMVVTNQTPTGACNASPIRLKLKILIFLVLECLCIVLCQAAEKDPAFLIECKHEDLRGVEGASRTRLDALPPGQLQSAGAQTVPVEPAHLWLCADASRTGYVLYVYEKESRN